MLIPAQKVAEDLGVNTQTVYRMYKNGILPGVRLGRRVRFDEAELQSWIKGGGKGLPGGWRREPVGAGPAKK